MKKTFLGILGLVLLNSCQRFNSSISKDFQTSKRHYNIMMYSGGDTVFIDSAYTIINSEDNSDGIYYYKGDTLVEVSGDYVLKSTK